MFLIILKTIHVFFGISAIGIGIPVLIEMISGRPFERWAIQFLRVSLLASAMGLLLSLYHADLMRWAAVLGVYASGIAVLAWRKFELAEGSALAFVLSTLSVLYLDTVIMLAHACRLLVRLNVIASWQPNLMFFASALMAIPLFAVFSVVSVQRLHISATDSIVQMVTR